MAYGKDITPQYHLNTALTNHLIRYGKLTFNLKLYYFGIFSKINRFAMSNYFSSVEQYHCINLKKKLNV